MQFVPTNDYREVSMYAGLNAIQIGNADKLYSDGLDANEYIYFDPVKGFCYEKRTVAKATECKMDIASVEHMTRQWIYCILSNGALVISLCKKVRYKTHERL